MVKCSWEERVLEQGYEIYADLIKSVLSENLVIGVLLVIIITLLIIIIFAFRYIFNLFKKQEEREQKMQERMQKEYAEYKSELRKLYSVNLEG